VLAERGAWDTRVLGVACDGTGYGDDATIWGGELFTGSVRGGFDRVAHLRPPCSLAATPRPGIRRRRPPGSSDSSSPCPTCAPRPSASQSGSWTRDSCWRRASAR
jgi:hypothetical protein